MQTQVGCRSPSIRKTWWKESSVYQIYPASFKDSNGDGVGDIPGIISKLDYIAWLGVDLVWLSPVLQSPQVDMGYDISDYRDIHPPYGTMADHDDLIKGLHDRGLKYVMDLVVNHTSSEHEWFKQSASSKSSTFRDWYIWRPARIDPISGARLPPNNWESFFSGSAWEWHEPSQEYYLHLFAPQQPDLNWDNPNVVKAVHELIRFWLNRGVDGFRLDVINFISKEPGLPDATVRKPGFLQPAIERFACGPKLHDHLQGIGAILKEYGAFSVGEMPGVYDERELAKAVGQDRGELGMAFHFEIVDIDGSPESKFVNRPFTPSKLRTIVNKWQTFMLKNGGWNALYMENHDQGRAISRYASDDPKYRTLSSKMLATHLLFQCGTPFIFQGQESAMANVPRGWNVNDYKDIELINHWASVLRDHPDDLDLQRRTLEQYRLISRDNARTPMQWDSAPFAGFMPKDSNTRPWMKMHQDFKSWNVKSQIDDLSSALQYWRSALALRKARKDVFVYGDFEMLDQQNENVITYMRSAADQSSKSMISTNFTDKDVLWYIPAEAKRIVEDGTIVLKNSPDMPMLNVEAGTIRLRPFEALVWLTNP